MKHIKIILILSIIIVSVFCNTGGDLAAQPSAFSKTSPSNGATNQPKTVTLNWAGSSGATSYSYCVGYCDPYDYYSWTDVGNNKSVVLTNRSPGANYDWQVRAHNADGITLANNGTMWSFTIEVVPPGAFSKTSPSNGATNQPKTVTLNWAGSSGATSYSYCVGYCDPYDYYSWTDVGNNKSVVLTNRSPGANYDWQVRAHNADGITLANNGTMWSFTVEVVPPGAFSKTSPSNGATNQPKTVTLNWAGSSGATSYSYCVGYCDPHDYYSWTDVGNNKSVVLTNRSPGANYDWQVRAHNTDGITLANNGTMWSFTIAAAPPLGVLEVSPSDNFVSTGNQGGPFNPLSKLFTVTNTGGESINYTVSKTQSWVSLSTTGGTLSPGGSTTVAVSINSGANSLISGSHNDTVTFTNTTNGSGNTTRLVSLTVNQTTSPQSCDDYLSFDGGDRVIIPNSPSLNPSQITVETWVKFNNISTGANAEFLICKGGDRTTGAYILGQGMLEDNTFGFEIAPFSSLWVIHTPPLSLETNTWYHVAGTYDGNTLRIYVDGVLQGSKYIGSVSIGNTSPLYFGYNDVGGFPYYFNGSLKEVRLWNTAKSESEIQADMNNTLVGTEPGLAGYWPLDDGSGQIVHDYSINGNNGQLGSTSGVDSDEPKWVSGTGWFDDFESYSLGTFPSSGGWQLIYNGAGSSSQYVDNTHSVSGLKSLRLTGSSSTPAGAYHPVDISSHISVEGKVFINQIESCGIEQAIATFNLRDVASTATFGSVRFNCDGKVYAVKDNIVNILTEPLMTYNAGTWYSITLDIDLTAKSFDIYIDGVLLGSNIPISNSGTPTAVFAAAGYGANANPAVWFDDIKVTSCSQQDQYALTVDKAGSGSGSVTSNPTGINCGNSCSSAFDAGTQVTLTAIASNGSTFSNWSGCDSTNANQCTVTLNAARTVTATFTLNTNLQYALTITKSGTGSGDISANTGAILWNGNSGTATYNSNSSVTLTAIASNGSTFSNWSGCDSTNANQCTVTLNAARTVTATFTLNTNLPHLDLSSASGAKGSTVTIPIILTNINGTSISAIGMDIGYDTAILENPTCTIGAAGSAAGKSCSASTPSSGIFLIGIVGLNNTVIGNGTVAYVTFTIKTTASTGSTQLSNTSSASDPSGNAVIINGSNGTITIITKAGDCDGDNIVSIAEVQSAINMYLGLKAVAACVDVNSNGKVTIDEVQKVINCYLGSC